MAVIGMVIVVSSACLSGLVMYANFVECDPYTMGYVTSSDQVITNSVLSLNSFKCMVRYYRFLEQYIYVKNNKFVSFDNRWKNIVLL